jgi:hypothetical protein
MPKQSIINLLVTLKKRRAIALLVLVFLLAHQAIVLQHRHNADFELRSDCDICLKLGSLDSAIPGTAESLPVLKSVHSYLPLIIGHLAKTAPETRSRAPPQFIS